ncbi:hypothetical protein ACFVH0_16525 [Streptomyces sp. NPDC127117]|uniref:hypothetical protein n=1 Tax=Streptomyces sp. NPDC127117 TaxID=3345368 RepID=UPI003637E9E4
MQAQHERVEATPATLDATVPAWAATAGADERDTLVAALADHRAALLEHLDDEEAPLLPLAAEHITEREWASPGGHSVANTPKLTLLTLFGLVLEDANPAGRVTLPSALPAPVPDIRHVIGRPRCARHISRLRAA